MFKTKRESPNSVFVKQPVLHVYSFNLFLDIAVKEIQFMVSSTLRYIIMTVFL